MKTEDYFKELKIKPTTFVDNNPNHYNGIRNSPAVHMGNVFRMCSRVFSSLQYIFFIVFYNNSGHAAPYPSFEKEKQCRAEYADVHNTDGSIINIRYVL